MAATPVSVASALVSARLRESDASSSVMVSPWPWMPRIWRSWLRPIIMPEAVMNPDTTGWDKKLARKPKRNSPITNSISPEISAMATAAVA